MLLKFEAIFVWKSLKIVRLYHVFKVQSSKMTGSWFHIVYYKGNDFWH